MTGRALVARLDSAGDVLLSGPAVRAVAAAPDIDDLWLLCSSLGAEAGRMLPGVDHVLTWDCPWITATRPPVSLEGLLRLDELIRSAAPDVAVILTSFHQSPLPLALQLRQAGVKRIVGASVDGAGTLLDVRLIPGEDFPEDQPESLRALRIAEGAGFPQPPEDDGRLRVRMTAPVPEAIRELNGFVAVHPGAAAPARCWPAAHFAEAVRRLHELGVDVVVTGAPGEKGLTRFVSGGGAYALDLGGRTGLPQLAATLAAADVVVTGNTGPAHLAAAVGTAVVSLFSPVVPARRWAPYGVPFRLLGDQQAPCRNTRARECPVPGHPCLTSVEPERVVEECLALAISSLPSEPETSAVIGGR